MDEETRAVSAVWLAGAAAVSARVAELAYDLPPSIAHFDRSRRTPAAEDAR